MKNKSLHELGAYYGTDKAVNHANHGEAHEYCNFYDYHLSSMRFENLKLLEIGIFDGASLRMWNDYFCNSEIYGIDLLLEPRAVLINEGRIHSYKLDAGDEVSLLQFVEEHGPFDIIIDDGSHFTNHQWLSWNLLANRCKVFIWEDLHTSRMPWYIRGTHNGLLPLDFAKNMSQQFPKKCYLFDKDNDEKHVTFLNLNITN